MCDTRNALIEELNPTFLFTWKGTRDGSGERYHSHDYAEFSFVLSGAGRYRIDDKIYEIAEGDLLILNPGTRHQVLASDPKETPCTEFFVAFTDIQLRDFPKNVLPVPQAGPILHTTGDLRQKLFKICSSMEAESTVYRQGKYYMLQSYLIQMILLVIREQYEPEENHALGYAFESVNKKYIVERIITFFEDHYAQKVSLDQIAENMYLSPFYISKIFKSETGDTPIRYLINIRLEKARDILEKDTDSSIKEVALSVGYDDAYHFSKLFKKKYGVSPSEVKKGNRSTQVCAPAAQTVRT